MSRRDSMVHLGVTIVRWPAGRRFQARSIYRPSKYSNQAALLPDGRVAWTGDSIFRFAYLSGRLGHEWWQLTEALHKLGAITPEVFAQERKKQEDYTSRKDLQEVAEDLVRNARALDLTLTPDQVKFIKTHAGIKI